MRFLLGLSFLLFATAAPAGLFSSKIAEATRGDCAAGKDSVRAATRS
jgi:hypothetical protein